MMPVLAVLMTAFIFANSMQNAEASSNLSMGLLRILSFLHISEFALRKTAHFTEFSLEGFFLKGTFKKKTAVFPLFWGLAAALTDETIQIFSLGRASKVSDVWIDFGGIIFGNIAFVIITAVIRKIKSR